MLILFLAHQIGISFVFTHVPVPARGKDKKRTAARRPHAGQTSSHDVILVFKWRHHVVSQRIQNFSGSLFHAFFSNIKWKCGT